MNGLERLERFFGASRKRDKEREVKFRNTPTASPKSPFDDGPHFPSPSFMRPTSISMKPREEQTLRTKVVKDRSQSLPDPQYTLRRRSSIGSTSIASGHRQQPSDPSRMLSLSIRPIRDPSNGQTPPRFRFPEDYLFANETVGQDGYANENNGEVQAQNMLDWRPQRLSSLFNTLGLDTSIDDRLARSTDASVAPMVLKPSPILSTPPSPKTKTNSTMQQRQLPQTPTEILPRKPTLLPRQDVLSLITKSYPDSPPASDEEDDDFCDPFNRQTTQKRLGSPIVFTPRQSIESKLPDSTEDRIRRARSIRESWGARPHDHVVTSTATDGDQCGIELQSLRKSVSESSLFVIRSAVIKHAESDSDIAEPTLDDFYALGDEDVAESLPATPKPDTDVPPTPPPKDSPEKVIGRSRSTRHAPIAPTATVNASSGELTPPCTPTDSQFLTLTYSPSHTSGPQGAMWAATIAQKYNFDLVYVISLWPAGEGVGSDPSRQLSSRSRTPRDRSGPTHVNDDIAQNAVVTNPKSKMTGRLLAGYGLDKFGSPFRVHAQFHTKMLGFSGWQEYRDELASPSMISRGWTCSFYGDHFPTISREMGRGHGPQRGNLNRGLVFAAYTRKTTKSAIPVLSSPKQTAILGKLRYDAQTLVDALVHGT